MTEVVRQPDGRRTPRRRPAWTTASNVAARRVLTAGLRVLCRHIERLLVRIAEACEAWLARQGFGAQDQGDDDDGDDDAQAVIQQAPLLGLDLEATRAVLGTATTSLKALVAAHAGIQRALAVAGPNTEKYETL